MSVCAHPGCMAQLHQTNTIGVCREHMHTAQCGCSQCAGVRVGFRVRSRDELVDLGLLPADGIFMRGAE